VQCDFPAKIFTNLSKQFQNQELEEKTEAPVPCSFPEVRLPLLMQCKVVAKVGA
jgi:hypothetical protein